MEYMFQSVDKVQNFDLVDLIDILLLCYYIISG